MKECNEEGGEERLKERSADVKHRSHLFQSPLSTSRSSQLNEADYIIPQQVGSAIKDGNEIIKVSCADSVVLSYFVLCTQERSGRKNAPSSILVNQKIQ